MTLDIFRGSTFGERLFEELSAQDDGPDFELLCNAIGSMFQQVEDLAGDAEIESTMEVGYIVTSLRPHPGLEPHEGLEPGQTEERLVMYSQRETYIGYSLLLDIDRIPIEWIAYLAQFIGVRVGPNLDENTQRQTVRNANNFERCRPKALIREVKATLSGTQACILTERYTGSAWRHKISVRGPEIIDLDTTLAAIKRQKAGPDIIDLVQEGFADYQWFKDHMDSYQDMKDTYATYADVKAQRGYDV